MTYDSARAAFADWGVDTEAAIKTLLSEERHCGLRARRGSPVGQLGNVMLEACPEP